MQASMEILVELHVHERWGSVDHISLAYSVDDGVKEFPASGWVGCDRLVLLQDHNAALRSFSRRMAAFRTGLIFNSMG
jgi:hypothetical protein